MHTHLVEGILDGGGVDDCFYCAVLYPDSHADGCPRCGKRMRYQPASWVEHHDVAEPVAGALDIYRATPTEQALTALLEVIHRHGEAGLDALSKLSVTVDDLRRDYETLGLGC